MSTHELPEQWVVYPVVDLTKIDLIVAPATASETTQGSKRPAPVIARILWPPRSNPLARKLICRAPEVYATLREALRAHDEDGVFDWERARHLLADIATANKQDV